MGILGGFQYQLSQKYFYASLATTKNELVDLSNTCQSRIAVSGEVKVFFVVFSTGFVSTLFPTAMLL